MRPEIVAAGGSEQMLEPLGVTETEEKLYAVLLGMPSASIDELARTLGVTSRQTRRVLASLEGKGLVSRLPRRTPTYIASPPDIALEALIRDRQEQLERLRLVARDMVLRFREQLKATNHREFVEVVAGKEAVLQRLKQIERTAREEILLFNKPPYAYLGLNELELEQLKQGIRYRVIYDRSALEVPGQLEWLSRLTDAGEEARALSGLPMKLLVVDQQLAAVPLYVSEPPQGGEPGIEEALIVHPGSLLVAFAANFETLWERAIPIQHLAQNGIAGCTEADPTDEDLRILTLMGAGLKDESIARQMGMGSRTVQRRISRLMDLLGTDTRFQAGLEAKRRGWL